MRLNLDAIPSQELLASERALAPFATGTPHNRLECCPTHMKDSWPFLFENARDARRRAIMCLNHKVGSTTWKLALLRGTNHASFHRLDRTPHGSASPASPGCEAATADRAVRRYMMVRNPYSRLLSGYLDKAVLQKDVKHSKKFWPRGFDPADAGRRPVAGFASFVHLVTSQPADEPLNAHFSLLTTKCHWEGGYDYVLPVEQMEAWYPPLVRALGLVEALSSGWNLTTRFWRGGRECFYAPRGRSCGWVREGADTAAPGGAAHAPATFHATNANEALDKYYTQALAAAVTRWARDDLAAFGYRAWDGVDGAGYMRSLRSGPWPGPGSRATGVRVNITAPTEHQREKYRDGCKRKGVRSKDARRGKSKGRAGRSHGQRGGGVEEEKKKRREEKGVDKGRGGADDEDEDAAEDDEDADEGEDDEDEDEDQEERFGEERAGRKRRKKRQQEKRNGKKAAKKNKNKKGRKRSRSHG